MKQRGLHVRLHRGGQRCPTPPDPGQTHSVEKAIGQLPRERVRLTVRAVAERASVSATFLYKNTDARGLIKHAVADHRNCHDHEAQQEQEQERIEASWRERALNAEEELARAQKEIFTQRKWIGELMGQICDVERMVPGESVQHASPRTPASSTHRALTECAGGSNVVLETVRQRPVASEISTLADNGSQTRCHEPPFGMAWTRPRWKRVSQHSPCEDVTSFTEARASRHGLPAVQQALSVDEPCGQDDAHSAAAAAQMLGSGVREHRKNDTLRWGSRPFHGSCGVRVSQCSRRR